MRERIFLCIVVVLLGASVTGSIVFFFELIRRSSIDITPGKQEIAEAIDQVKQADVDAKACLEKIRHINEYCKCDCKIPPMR